ncbi:hypothetical protein HDU98_005576 [Podochytrium sp. JEL0797]|nr:hypothetical protein HDU98_005576 [Podochytrium sp. JEL0797]
MDKFVIRKPSAKAAAAAAAAEPAPADVSDSEAVEAHASDDDQSSPATITSLKRKLAAMTKENKHLAAEPARKISCLPNGSTPTKTNKPTSIITIVRFANFEDLQKLLGTDALDATTEFSMPIRRNRSFQKAVKVGEARCSIQSMDAAFSTSNMSVELKFQMVGESE